MATTKNTYTNATALAKAIELLENCGDADLLAKLDRMYKTATKPRSNGQKVETAEQRKNREEYIPAMLSAMRSHGEPVTAKWISENVSGIMTTQKATGLLGICIKAGTVERIQVGKTVTFMAL